MSSKLFIKTFDSIAKQNHRYTVFSDFVTISAISLHNAVNTLDHLEADLSANKAKTMLPTKCNLKNHSIF